MTASAGFLELLQDLLAPLGRIGVRRMFGGAGIYCDGAVFAFVDDDALYLKTDAAGRESFGAEGMGPFTYRTKHGPGTLLSYWQAPERLLEDPDAMLEWARRALVVANAARRSGPGRGRGATPPRVRRAPRSKRHRQDGKGK